MIFIQNFELNFGQTCPSGRGIIQEKKRCRCEKNFVWEVKYQSCVCAKDAVKTADGSCSPRGPRDWSVTQSRFWAGPFRQIGFEGQRARTLIKSKSVRKGDSLPVIPEKFWELPWEKDAYIDSLSAWYDTRYYSQLMIEKYQGKRQILLLIEDAFLQENSFERNDISDKWIRYLRSRKSSISTQNLSPILKNRSKRSANNLCLDYYAIFNPETELCECIAGFQETDFGCQLFEDAECHPSNAISDEILRRLNETFTVSNGDAKRKRLYNKLRNLLGDHSESLKKRSCNSAKRACGRSSRAANYFFYNDLLDIGTDYKNLLDESYTDQDTNINAIKGLIHLLNKYFKQSLFDCLRGGWGYDPTGDGSADVGGIQCTEGGWRDRSQRRYLKCRLEIRLNNLLNELLSVV